MKHENRFPAFLFFSTDVKHCSFSSPPVSSIFVDAPCRRTRAIEIYLSSVFFLDSFLSEKEKKNSMENFSRSSIYWRLFLLCCRVSLLLSLEKHAMHVYVKQEMIFVVSLSLCRFSFSRFFSSYPPLLRIIGKGLSECEILLFFLFYPSIIFRYESGGKTIEKKETKKKKERNVTSKLCLYFMSHGSIVTSLNNSIE